MDKVYGKRMGPKENEVAAKSAVNQKMTAASKARRAEPTCAEKRKIFKETYAKGEGVNTAFRFQYDQYFENAYPECKPKPPPPMAKGATK